MFVVTYASYVFAFLISPADISQLAIGTIRLLPFLRIMAVRSCCLRCSSHPRQQRLLGVTQIVGHLQVHPEFHRRIDAEPLQSDPCCETIRTHTAAADSLSGKIVSRGKVAVLEAAPRALARRGAM